MDTVKILMWLVIAVLALNLLAVGVYLNEKGVFKFSLPEMANKGAEASENASADSAEGISIQIYGKCSELNGTSCSLNESCAGDWIDSSDSFTCCSAKCESSNKTAETTSLFEPVADDPELGEVI